MKQDKIERRDCLNGVGIAIIAGLTPLEILNAKRLQTT